MRFSEAPLAAQSAVKRIAFRAGVTIPESGVFAGPFDELLGQLADILMAALQSFLQSCPMAASEMKQVAMSTGFAANYHRLRLARVARHATEAEIGPRWTNRDRFDYLVEKATGILWDGCQDEDAATIEQVRRAFVGA